MNQYRMLLTDGADGHIELNDIHGVEHDACLFY